MSAQRRDQFRQRAIAGDLAELCVTSRDRRPLRPSDVGMIPGPGAAAATKARLARDSSATVSGESQSTRQNEANAPQSAV
jgi:hypothetical protein